MSDRELIHDPIRREPEPMTVTELLAVSRDYASHRERGTCDADDPATCARCEDMEASPEHRLLEHILVLSKPPDVSGCAYPRRLLPP